MKEKLTLLISCAALTLYGVSASDVSAAQYRYYADGRVDEMPGSDSNTMTKEYYPAEITNSTVDNSTSYFYPENRGQTSNIDSNIDVNKNSTINEGNVKFGASNNANNEANPKSDSGFYIKGFGAIVYGGLSGPIRGAFLKHGYSVDDTFIAMNCPYEADYKRAFGFGLGLGYQAKSNVSFELEASRVNHIKPDVLLPPFTDLLYDLKNGYIAPNDSNVFFTEAITADFPTLLGGRVSTLDCSQLHTPTFVIRNQDKGFSYDAAVLNTHYSVPVSDSFVLSAGIGAGLAKMKFRFVNYDVATESSTEKDATSYPVVLQGMMNASFHFGGFAPYVGYKITHLNLRKAFEITSKEYFHQCYPIENRAIEYKNLPTAAGNAPYATFAMKPQYFTHNIEFGLKYIF